ncbi:hypothetical protein [Amycolatopsis sp. cmx-4-68]|uniref:hypothetical protein n=1 Tax=Amycolatopsis sp. cmx-4-68 TaxID=2790938 RepID=UPI003978D73A
MTATPYQNPYGPPPAQPQRPSGDPGALLRLLAGILGALAAVLVLAGSFLPQTSFEQIVDGKTESSQTVSAWSRSFDVEPDGDAKKFYESTHVARYGIPLSTGAVVLLAGAGLALAGARRSARAGLRANARTALVAGGAGVAAAVWMLGMDVSATLSYESDEGSVRSHYSTGAGFWVLLGGGVLALATLVLAVLAGRRAAADAPTGPTPGPYGTPGPYQQQSRPYPVPSQQYPGAYPVQGGGSYPGQGGAYPGGPYPGPAGQPGAGPAGGPSSQPFPAQSGGLPSSAQSGGPSSQPFPAQSGGLPSQPSSAQSGEPPSPGQAGGPSSQPFPAQQPGDPYGGATQAHQHPTQQDPPSPTEPTYQLPPLNPPKT